MLELAEEEEVEEEQEREENQPASSLVKQRGGVILRTFPKNPPDPISTPNSEISV